jgi:flagellar basal body-associated protein FliL
MKTPFSVFERILIIILLVAALFIGAVSLWAVVFRSGDERGVVNNTFEPDEGAAVRESGQEILMYTGIGRLRAQLKAEGQITPPALIISPVFPYNGADKAFTEELASRLRDFRRVTLEYFSTLTINSADLSNDETLKAVLIARYNALLRLGRIETLFFTEFMLIE